MQLARSLITHRIGWAASRNAGLRIRPLLKAEGRRRVRCRSCRGSVFLVLGFDYRTASVLLRLVEEFELPFVHLNRHSTLTSDGRIPLTTPN